jgi:outer membrane protein TolC
MKRYLIIILVIATGILTARQYTLEDMIEAGLNSSYSMRQKNIMLKNAGLGVQNAAWNLLPSADVSFRRANTDERYSSNGSVVVSKSLTLNEPTYFNYRQASLDKSIAKLDWQQSKKELVYGIYTAWLDLAQLQKEISIREANLAVLRIIKQQTELKMQLGQRTAFDVNQSEINVINAELAIAELNNLMIKLRADLFNKVKLTDDGGDLLYAETRTDLEPEFEDAEEEPFLLRQLRYDVKKSGLSKLQQKIGLLPTVVASATYGQYSTNNDVLQFDNYEDSYTLSLGVSWSLWTPFTKGSSYAQVRNSLTLKQWQYEEQQAALRLQKDNLRREWAFLSGTLALNTKKAAQATDNLRIAQERYNLGSLSLIELEQARVAALEAELAVNKLSFQLQKKAEEWNLLNSLLILDRY